eukprot:1564497-Heterocapsa_arctica.AAC.1
MSIDADGAVMKVQNARRRRTSWIRQSMSRPCHRTVTCPLRTLSRPATVADPRARQSEGLELVLKVSSWMRMPVPVVVEWSAAPWTGARLLVDELRSVIRLRLVHRPASRCWVPRTR